ncbi:hypothetical protein TWF696_002090 [Orbilia brochopaga]|uniref:F-box domain-containing protein n=1 Tax=Orbilia brochopaga TaxID=3140254 RepID=A0AAV9U7H3_9PEZI
MVVFIDLDADTVERDFPGYSDYTFSHHSTFPHHHHHHHHQPQHQHHHHHSSPPSAPVAAASSSAPSAAAYSPWNATAADPSSARPAPPRSRASAAAAARRSKDRTAIPAITNPNDTERLTKLFRVIGIYPCIRSIAAHLDRTDLYNLSSTCRNAHNALLENRRHLLPFTLRCHCATARPLSPPPSTPASRRPTLTPLGAWLATQCVSDLVNLCDRCRNPACRNCKARSPKLPGQSAKRATCTTCSSAPLSTLTEDPTIKPCTCQSKGEPWICGSCAVIGMENYLLKTKPSRTGVTATVELECGRGISCLGKGWYTCENFYAYLDNSGKEEKFRGQKVRYACSSCKQFVFSKDEEKEFLALKA